MTTIPLFCRFGIPLLAVALLLTSCSTTPEEPPLPPYAQERQQQQSDSFWHGDGVSGSPRLVIDLSAQRVRYYKGQTLVGMSPISSGREGHSTVTGTFRVSEKDIDHRSSLYGDYVDAEGNVVMEDVDVRKDARPPGSRFLGAKMNYFMRVAGAIGMHEGYLPGYPASHGCIRLPSDMAAKFYHATPHGTPVQIVGNAAHAEYEPPVMVRTAAPTPPPKTRKSRGAPGSKPGRRASPGRQPAVPPGTTLYL